MVINRICDLSISWHGIMRDFKNRKSMLINLTFTENSLLLGSRPIFPDCCALFYIYATC